MAYTRTNWVDGPAGGTPITADRLNNMEAGIAAANPTTPVTSVAGKTGAVTLVAADAGADPTGTANTAVSNHNALTTNIHGIVDTATLLRPTLRMPQRPAPSSIVTHFQTGHGWTRTGSGSSSTASNLNDTTAANVAIGTQSVTIATTGTCAAGQYANVESPGTLTVNLTGGLLRVLVKIDDISHIGALNVFAGDATLANYYKWQIQLQPTPSTNIVTSGDWCWVTLNIGDAVASGTPPTSAIAKIALQVSDDNTANPVVAHWNGVEVVPNGSAIFPNGVVSLCFDDCWQSTWDYARPKLDQYGYAGTIYAITDYVGTFNKLTLAEMQTMQDQLGWEVTAHAFTGANHQLSATGMSASQLDLDARNQKSWLITNGFRADGYAYPLGQYGLTTDGVSTQSVLRKYFAYARTTLGKSAPNGVGLRQTFPSMDPWRLRAQSSISTFTPGGYAPANLTTATTGDLDKAKANAQWLILVFHNIVTGAPANVGEIAQSDFNAIVDGINSRGIPVLPVGDVLRYYG